MATKLYFHSGTTTDTGTLPAAGTSVSTTVPTQIAAGGDTNRTMDTTIGPGQTSNALTTLANTSQQPSLMLRFCSAPIAAQTIASVASGVTVFGVAGSVSNTNSNFAALLAEFIVWRPSTGAVVGRMINVIGLGSGPGTTLVNSTSEVWGTGNTQASSTAVTSADGDILIVELWRDNSLQGMSTAYTNTIFYDGTTEGSVTNAASYINWPDTITFFTPAAPAVMKPEIFSAIPFMPAAGGPTMHR